MRVQFIKEANVLFSHSSSVPDKEEFFQKANPKVPISHVGEEARKILCDQSTLSVVRLSRYCFADSIPAKDFEDFVEMLNPELFIKRELLKEILLAHTPMTETILMADGHWNLIPTMSKNLSVVLGVAYIGDGWRISRRRIRDDSDTRGEDIAPGDYLILRGL